MIKIQIPATSANLGAGFDALGLALTYYNYIEMEECDKIDITAADGLDIPTDERNLIYISAKDLFAVCGKKLEGLKLIQTSNIPMARACLPKEVSHKDAVYNLSRAALFSASLLTGKFENLKTAVDDRLHQPYRMALIPHCKDVFDIAYTHGAYAAYISGAGPTIMAIVDESNQYFAGKMKFSLDNAGLKGWQVKEFHIDNEGTKLI